MATITDLLGQQDPDPEDQERPSLADLLGTGLPTSDSTLQAYRRRANDPDQTRSLMSRLRDLNIIMDDERRQEIADSVYNEAGTDVLHSRRGAEVDRQAQREREEAATRASHEAAMSAAQRGSARDATGLPQPGVLPEDQDSGNFFTGPHISPVEEFVNSVVGFVQDRNQRFAEDMEAEGVTGGPHPLLEILGPEVAGIGGLASLPLVSRGARPAASRAVQNVYNNPSARQRLRDLAGASRRALEDLGRLATSTPTGRTETRLFADDLARAAETLPDQLKRSRVQGTARMLQTGNPEDVGFVAKMLQHGHTPQGIAHLADRAMIEELLLDLPFSGGSGSTPGLPPLPSMQ